MASDGEASEPEAVSSRRNWQGQKSAATDGARASRRRLKILVVTGLLSALIALLVVLIPYLQFSPTPTPHFLAINVANIHRHFPLQSFARADSELLMRHFDKQMDATTKTKELLRKELKGLKDRSTEPLVIHLTALALVRGETVYLLPADAEPDNEATWLNIEEVLDAVKNCPAQHKLLILDLAHGLIDPRLGVFADRVAATLEAAFIKEKPSFLVLCPCKAGQSSLTSEVLRSSVFAYFLDQGLMGAADTDNDGRITVRELFDFVETKVDRWARNNRGVQQVPLLFGKDKDKDNFILAAPGREAPDLIVPTAPDPYPEVLLKAWEKRDEAWARGAFYQAPRSLLRLEANLLRDENRWRGGAADKDFALDQETRNLITELTALPSAPAPRLLSVLGAKENQAATDAVFNILRRVTDAKKAQEEIAKLLLADKKADYPQQARSVVEALSRLPELKQEHVKIAQAVLAGLKEPTPLVEVLYVDRLAGLAEREFAETFQQAKAEVVWRTMREHEAVLAALAFEPEFLPWVASMLESADKKRRIAEGKLLWERPPAWPAALQDLKSSGEVYARAKKTLDEMMAGSVALERAFAELPVHLRVLCDGPDADAQVEQMWLKAAEEAAYLQKFFLAPPDARNVADAKLDTRGRELQQQLDELKHSFRRRLKSAENADTATAQRQMRCLLQSPRFSAAERADLFKKLRESAKKLHDATDTKDQAASIAAERNAGVVRAQMSLALLRLMGSEPDAPELLLPPPKEPASLPAIEKRLHLLWGTDGLVKHWGEALHDRRGQAISRLVSPWDAKGEDQGNPWQTKLRDDQLNWLRRQYEAESREAGPSNRKVGDPRDQETRDFYRDAAQ